MTGQPIPYVARLRTELVRAVDEHGAVQARRRRRRIALALATAVAIIAPLAVSLVLRGGPATPALAIEREGGLVTVRLVDAAADPEQMTRELTDAGIDAVVAAVPAPAPLVGRWTGGSIGGHTDGIVWTDDVITFPTGARNIVLQVGRPAGPAEEPAVGTNPFAPGGILHCSGVEDLSPVDAAAELERRGLGSAWLAAGADAVAPEPPPGDLVIIDAATHGTMVVFELAPRGDADPERRDIPEQDCDG